MSFATFQSNETFHLEFRAFEKAFLSLHLVCSVIPAHRNWQIETAVWNLAGSWLLRFFLLGKYVSFA